MTSTVALQVDSIGRPTGFPDGGENPWEHEYYKVRSKTINTVQLSHCADGDGKPVRLADRHASLRADSCTRSDGQVAR